MSVDKQLDRAADGTLDTITVFVRRDGCSVNIKNRSGGWECNDGLLLSETFNRALSRFLGEKTEPNFMDLLQ